MRVRTDQKLNTKKDASGTANSAAQMNAAGANSGACGPSFKLFQDGRKETHQAFWSRAYSVRKSSYVAVVPSYSDGGTGWRRAFCMKPSISA